MPNAGLCHGAWRAGFQNALVETPGGRPRDPVSQTLRNAVDAAGGVKALAGVLEVPEPVLEQWLEGSSPPPEDVLLKAADLVYRRAVATLQRANKQKK